MKCKKYVLLAAAVLVIGVASISPAMAYFTDSREAVGTATVHLGELEITPLEKVTEWTKEIQVQNTGDYDVFVRVQAIYGAGCDVSFTADANWSEKNGYYEYSKPLAPEETSPVLKLTFTPNNKVELGDTFNVVIVQEAARAQTITDADGNTKLGCKWDEAILKRDEFRAQFEEINEGGNNE